jgi:signal transduction histidine kinase
VKALRIRIALLLIFSVIAVVGLATSATIFVFGPRGPEVFAEPIVMQLKALIPLFETLESDSSNSAALLDAPKDGAAREMPTRIIRKALLDHGIANRVIITQPPNSDLAAASIELRGGHWVALPVSDLERSGGPWLALASWISLIIAGTLTIALGVAHRLARPLALLESVASTISRSGQMRMVPETGPTEVKTTARALNRLTENLKAAMESRMRLVAAAGHDLRTPITRMRLRAEFLPDQEQTAWLRDLDELRRIADSSIQLVHEEVEKKSNELVRLDELVITAVEELTKTGLSIELLGSIPVLIRAAPLAITRMLRNLLINAATHGKSCQVLLESQQSWAVVVIEDDGPGIPAAVIGRVFEPFFRIDPARQQSIPGAGLGLAIAREIVGRYDGQIILENRDVGGLRQEIRFPLEHQSLADGIPTLAGAA